MGRGRRSCQGPKKKENEKCCITEVDGRKCFKEKERLTVSDTAEGLVRVGILLYLALGLQVLLL